MRREAPDLIGSLLLVALGSAVALGSLQYGILNEQGRIGSGFMPFMSGVLLALFGALIGVEAWRRSRRPRPARADPGADPLAALAAAEGPLPAASEDDGAGWRTIAVVFALTLVAIVLIPLLGFLLPFAALIFVLVRFVEGESARLAIALSVSAIVVTWLVFVVFLGVPLPSGTVGESLGL